MVSIIAATRLRDMGGNLGFILGRHLLIRHWHFSETKFFQHLCFDVEFFVKHLNYFLFQFVSTHLYAQSNKKNLY